MYSVVFQGIISRSCFIYDDIYSTGEVVFFHWIVSACSFDRAYQLSRIHCEEEFSEFGSFGIYSIITLSN